MVAGLEEITGGEIAIGPRVVNELEPADRDIAMVFQNYALYPHMSVFDNMAYGLKIKKLPRDEISRRVDKAAGILELSHLLARKPRELSGGQRQRVAMGRAIVREPQVFLFDEPLSNLDAKLRVQTRLEIQKLHRELGITSLFVTHDQVEAMTLAQRMIVMNAGSMEQFGTPDEVYARPATTFVAGFIGSPPMNLVLGRMQGSRFEMPGLGRRPAGRTPGRAMPTRCNWACGRSTCGSRRTAGRSPSSWWRFSATNGSSTPSSANRRWWCAPTIPPCTAGTRRRAEGPAAARQAALVRRRHRQTPRGLTGQSHDATTLDLHRDTGSGCSHEHRRLRPLALSGLGRPPRRGQARAGEHPGGLQAGRAPRLPDVRMRRQAERRRHAVPAS